MESKTKIIWDFIHGLHRHQGYNGLSHKEKFTRYKIITVSADNYYLVTFLDSSKNVIQFKIEINYSLVKSECNYILSKVYVNSVPTNFTGGNEETIERELKPFIRDYKLEKLGV